jgi:hypothetical protein
MGKGGQKRHSKVIWAGFSNAPLPRQVLKVGRNDPCPCGSNKKYKDCHESEGSTYLEKLGRKREQERMKAMRRHMKEQGVPWWKRIFIRA